MKMSEEKLEEVAKTVQLVRDDTIYLKAELKSVQEQQNLRIGHIEEKVDNQADTNKTFRNQVVGFSVGSLGLVVGVLGLFKLFGG